MSDLEYYRAIAREHHERVNRRLMVLENCIHSLSDEFNALRDDAIDRGIAVDDRINVLTRRLDALTETLADAPDGATETTDGRAVVSWAELVMYRQLRDAVIAVLDSDEKCEYVSRCERAGDRMAQLHEALKQWA